MSSGAPIEFVSFNWESSRAPALSPMQLDVIFKVTEEGLQDSLELKMVYIHSQQQIQNTFGPGNLTGNNSNKKSDLPPADDEDSQDAAEDVLDDGADDDLCIANEDIVIDELEIPDLMKLGKRKVSLNIGSEGDVTSQDGQQDEDIVDPVCIDFNKIDEKAKLDVAAVAISASYRGREFYRIGWYIRYEYEDEKWNGDGEEAKGLRPKIPEMEKVVRVVDVENCIQNETEIGWGKLIEDERRKMLMEKNDVNDQNDNDMNHNENQNHLLKRENQNLLGSGGSDQHLTYKRQKTESGDGACGGDEDEVEVC